MLIVLYCNASLSFKHWTEHVCMFKILSVIAVSMVSSDNILCRQKHKDKYQSFCRKGIFMFDSMTAMNIAKLKSLVITYFFSFTFIPL